MLAIAVVSWVVATAVTGEASSLKTVRRVLAAPDEIAVYSLDPSNESRWGEDGKCVEPCFLGYPRLGNTPPISQQERGAVVGELVAWLDAPEPEAVLMCYIPRHGVTVRSGNTSLEFLLCYECAHGEVKVTGGTEPSTHLYWPGNVEVLNEVLERHDVPLPPPDEV